jgi:Flp pilus assembly protein TadD
MTRPLLILTFAAFLAGCGSSGNGPTVTATPTGPDTPLARRHNDWAFALLQQGKYADAEQQLRKAIEADVMYGPARNNLGLVFFHQDKLYPAAWEFQNAIRLMPHQPEPRNNLGLVFERAGKIGEAVEAFEKARKMEPDNPEYIGNLARVRVRRGDRDDETKKLLQELVFKDTRPDWRDWARQELVHFHNRPVEPGPAATTMPAR